jgi:hypothetical protein
VHVKVADPLELAIPEANRHTHRIMLIGSCAQSPTDADAVTPTTSEQKQPVLRSRASAEQKPDLDELRRSVMKRTSVSRALLAK